MSDRFAITHLKPSPHQWLRFGEIRPQGWLRLQMQRDLDDGFLGHLDDLMPGLIRDDDIHGRDRLTALSKHKDLGTVVTAAAQTQYMWWNSETQSNWRDGLVRTALLLDHAAALPQPGSHRLYFDFGAATLDASYEPYQRRMDARLAAAGYKHGVNWLARKFPGAEHSEKDWRTRVHIPLEFLPKPVTHR